MLPYNPRTTVGRPNPNNFSPPSRSRSASRPRYADTERNVAREEQERMAAYPLSSARSSSTPSQSLRGRISSSSSSDLVSVSSSGSSFLERMKSRSTASTPRTSLEDDDQPKTSLRRNWSTAKINPPEATELNGTWGNQIWNRLATAAGSLSVNVDLSWASNMSAYAGEETPVGQESRLTQAMKAYHIGKAQLPSDLPAWLFDERERRAVSRSQATPSAYHALEEDLSTEVPRRGGLREIYDTAAATTPMSRSTHTGDTVGMATAGGSKAANRLKAIRDAKRQAAAPTYMESLAREELAAFHGESHKGHGHGHHSGDHRRDAHGRLDNVDATRRPPQGRVGLPSRPARPHARGN